MVQLHLPPVLAELKRHDALCLVVSFAPLSRLQAWLPHFRANFIEPYYQEHALPLPSDLFERTIFAADPQLNVYHAYGLGRNSALKIYGPSILRQYARWFLQGKPVKKPQEDPLQRGGNFVIDRNQRITLAHTGRDQADRPSVAALLAALAK